MKALLNPRVLELKPYQPGKPMEELRRELGIEKIVRLVNNENPFSLPKNVSDAIQSQIETLHLYPDTDSFYLRKRIAEYNGVAIENVIMGSGTAELIRMITKAFLKPTEKVMTAVSTFPLYKISATENGGREAIVEVEMDAGYGIDIGKMYSLANKNTKIIFIANPNNPTGTLLPKDKLKQFIESIPKDKIIVLDNAYQEYVPDPNEHLDGIELALRRPNVIVLRTFSKIYALAGLRVGYAIANAETILYLNRVRAPFNLTRVAQEAALMSLENDDFKNDSAALNLKNKEKLFKQLVELGIKVVPSFANFILFFPGQDVVQVEERLLRDGVIIKALGRFGIPDGMRVTVGFEEDNDFFVEKLKKVLCR